MQYFAFELTGLPAFLVIALLLYIFIYLPIKIVITLIAHAKKKTDHVRLLQQKTIIAEYDPPNDLSPAEIGYLYDSKTDIEEIYATIIYLQQQGLVELTEIDNKQTISGVKKTPNQIKDFDKYILSELQKNQGKDLSKGLLRQLKQPANLILNNQLQAEGYLLPTREQIKKSLLRLLTITAGLITLTIIIFRPNTASGITAITFLFVFLSPLYFGMSFFLFLKFQKITGQPWLGTPKLKAAWTNIEGYRQYIEQVEFDNLKFESLDTKQAAKNKTLPYAVALGFDTGWLKKVA